ncbi:MAG: hypothetical protein Q7S08_03650, partial [bacterium]|nr:hypothetical protein [bacterium]
MKTKSIVGDASDRQLVGALIVLALLLFTTGLFPVRSSGMASNLKTSNAEVGFSSVSPRGAEGGFIVPASCESGLGEGGVSHFPGFTGGQPYGFYDYDGQFISGRVLSVPADTSGDCQLIPGGGAVGGGGGTGTWSTDGSCNTVHYGCKVGTSASQVEAADSWTWACNGLNGGSNASCSEARSWTNYCTGGNDPYGHSWQIWRYDNSNPPSYEFVGTDLATCGPFAKVDGSCGVNHWGCSTGTSANNAGGDTGPWTWSCRGSNGGLDVSCSQPSGGPSNPGIGNSGTGGTGTGTGTGIGGTGTGSCVVKGWVAIYQCSGSAPGSELIGYNNCGSVVNSNRCTYGCSGGACDPPPPITFTSSTANAHKGTQTTFTATGHLQVRPALVRQSDPTWVYWNVQNAS